MFHCDVYYYVVLSEGNKLHNIKDLIDELKKNFVLVKTLIPMRKIYSHTKQYCGLVPEILFKADTLFAAVSPGRASLFQKEHNPFTVKDLELRKKILSLYPNKSNLGYFSREPSFKEVSVMSLQG